MKMYEIIKLGKETLDLLQKSCISISDCQYLCMYEEYERMLKDGCKSYMIVSHLAKKYLISERRVYYLIKKYKMDCKIGAV